MKNLYNPTPAQIKYRNLLWAEALKKNRKKAKNAMYRNGGRCCLAVAQNVAIEHGVDVDKRKCVDVPHKEVARFFGWGSVTPYLLTPTGAIRTASDINDGYNGEELSHAKIAECVLNTFVHPSEKTPAKIEKKSAQAQIIKKMLAEKKKEYHAAKKKLDEDYSSFLKTVYS